MMFEFTKESINSLIGCTQRESFTRAYGMVERNIRGEDFLGPLLGISSEMSEFYLFNQFVGSVGRELDVFETVVLRRVAGPIGLSSMYGGRFTARWDGGGVELHGPTPSIIVDEVSLLISSATVIKQFSESKIFEYISNLVVQMDGCDCAIRTVANLPDLLSFRCGF